MAIVGTAIGTAAALDSAGIPVSKTINNIISSVGDFVGRLFPNRAEKQRKRDEFLSKLKAAGMDSDIYLGHSDNWGVLKIYYELYNQLGGGVIDILNEKYQGAGAKNDGVNRIYSENSDQFKTNISRIEQLYSQIQDAGYLQPGPDQPTGRQPEQSGGTNQAGVLLLAAASIFVIFQLIK